MTAPGTGHPIEGLLADLFLRSGAGHPAYEQDAESHRLRIAAEWRSGQWVMITSRRDRLWGWASYYRVSDEVLALLRHWEIGELVRRGDAVRDLTQGPHLYVATAIVTPGAPRGTYLRLYDLLRDANPDARSWAAHFRSRNGKVRWMHRALMPEAAHASSHKLETEVLT